MTLEMREPDKNRVVDLHEIGHVFVVIFGVVVDRDLVAGRRDLLGPLVDPVEAALRQVAIGVDGDAADGARADHRPLLVPRQTPRGVRHPCAGLVVALAQGDIRALLPDVVEELLLDLAQGEAQPDIARVLLHARRHDAFRGLRLAEFQQALGQVAERPLVAGVERDDVPAQAGRQGEVAAALHHVRAMVEGAGMPGRMDQRARVEFGGFDILALRRALVRHVDEEAGGRGIVQIQRPREQVLDDPARLHRLGPIRPRREARRDGGLDRARQLRPVDLLHEHLQVRPERFVRVAPQPAPVAVLTRRFGRGALGFVLGAEERIVEGAVERDVELLVLAGLAEMPDAFSPVEEFAGILQIFITIEIMIEITRKIWNVDSVEARGLIFAEIDDLIVGRL